MNVSRTVVEDIRNRFAKSLIIEIRVDPIVLIERLARRGRENSEVQKERFGRSASLVAMPAPDVVIDNNGEADAAITGFIKVLQSLENVRQPDAEAS